MNQTDIDISALAERVDSAALNATPIEQLSLASPFTLQQAYAIKTASIQRRLDRGEHLIGIKMGFTSQAKMTQMGVDDMIWGRLTNTMLLEEGGELDLSRYIHPRIEPEIAFILKKPLIGEITAAQALSAVEAIVPAMEVIDSRYQNFKFSLEDVVADNSSSSGLVLGNWHSPKLDIENLGMVLEFDGREVQIGSSAAILGHPIRSLVAAARLAGEAELELQPGWIIMAGAATAAEAITPGTHISARVEKLGRLSINSNG